MSDQSKENYKRLVNKLHPSNTSQDANDTVRFKDFAAYTGILSVNHIHYNPTPTVPPVHREGISFWDAADRTLNLMTEVSGTTIQVGQEAVLRGTNRTGSTIPNGAVCYIDGAQGNRPTINLASADGHTTARGTIGLATNTIENNQTGYITTFGLVRDVNTAGIFEGAPAFLSETSGTFQGSVPDAPSTTVFLGIVARSHAVKGIVFVKIVAEPNIEELSNVSHDNLSDGDTTAYNAASGVWVNTNLIQVDTVASGIGFLGASPISRPTITGSRGGNAALTDLLTALDSFGIITDGTSA